MWINPVGANIERSTSEDPNYSLTSDPIISQRRKLIYLLLLPRRAGTPWKISSSNAATTDLTTEVVYIITTVLPTTHEMKWEG